MSYVSLRAIPQTTTTTTTATTTTTTTTRPSALLQSFKAQFFQDGRPLNVNGVYDYLKRVEIPEDFLSKIYVQRCEFNYTNTCSAPDGMFTDLNVWDRALTQEEAEAWTSCR